MTIHTSLRTPPSGFSRLNPKSPQSEGGPCCDIRDGLALSLATGVVTGGLGALGMLGMGTGGAGVAIGAAALTGFAIGDGAFQRDRLDDLAILATIGGSVAAGAAFGTTGVLGAAAFGMVAGAYLSQTSEFR
ncbi:hypothetical protein IV102_12070 [bacterium]|nr:hypothetical protein [bacterium]